MKLHEIIGKEAMLLQTAEECTELAKACLKMARKINGKNPTPKTMEEIKDNLYEEVADVLICINELELDPGILTEWSLKKESRLGERFGSAYSNKSDAENVSSEKKG